jgi:7-cyano-7-deazaguanine synthase
MKKKKVVVQVSGGLDSTVALASLLAENWDCYGLGFIYGQRHLKEVNQAARICKHYGVPFVTTSVSIPSKSALIGPAGDLNRDKNGLPGSFVPGRNIVFTALAGSYAYDIQAEAIAGGWNYTDYPGYPDCRPAFLISMMTTLRHGLNCPEFSIVMPVVNMTKKQIIQRGFDLKVPFELTWSCYEGRDKPCGVCSSCRFRAEGFKELGMKDPLME